LPKKVNYYHIDVFLSKFCEHTFRILLFDDFKMSVLEIQTYLFMNSQQNVRSVV